MTDNIILLRLEFPSHIPASEQAKDLLFKLLEKDPAKRITIEESKVKIS